MTMQILWIGLGANKRYCVDAIVSSYYIIIYYFNMIKYLKYEYSIVAGWEVLKNISTFNM